MLGVNLRHKWLRGELPSLVAKGIIDEETSTRLAAHYESPPVGQGWIFAAFGALGALCILGGVILVLAHNWEHLGRFVKVGLSVTPLLLCHLLALYIHLTGRTGAAWREGAGVAMNLSLAAALGLISQTYNLGGTFEEFVRVWSLLALPIPYVTGSVGAALLWCATWLLAFGNPADARDIWQFWPGLLALAPFLYRLQKAESEGPRTHLASLAAAFSIAVGACMSFKFLPDPDLLALFLLAVGAAFHLAGRRDGSEAAWKNPFGALGSLGLTVGVFFFSWDKVWLELARTTNRLPYWYRNQPGWFVEYGYLLLAAALGIWVLLTVRKLLRRDFDGLFLGSLPLIYLAIRYLLAPANPLAASFVMNLYGLALGVLIIRDANRDRQIGKLNAGMGVIAILAVMRFVDSDLSMVLRGVAFMATGAAFLAANWWMLRVRRAS